MVNPGFKLKTVWLRILFFLMPSGYSGKKRWDLN